MPTMLSMALQWLLVELLGIDFFHHHHHNFFYLKNKTANLFPFPWQTTDCCSVIDLRLVDGLICQ